MLLVGLSGGIGSGKSTVGRALAARGAEVIDVDDVGRDILARGSEGERSVLAHFGSRVASPGGGLDRQALATIVFADGGERRFLETLTHPLIHQEVTRRVAGSTASILVVELPLLDAARRHSYGFDVVVLVDPPEETAIRRAVARGMTEQDVRARIAAQPTHQQRRSVADRVVANTGTLEALEAELSELWAWLVVVAGEIG
jgi:dephospho-CoA kinase